MAVREALVSDIEAIHVVRTSVKENRLSNPNRISFNDYDEMLTLKGKGWVFEVNNKIVGFAVADATIGNIWALFILPDFEGQGIGKILFSTMVKWLFSRNIAKLWLTTDPKSRAYDFYTKAGWKDVGMYNNEIRFELEKP